MFSRLSRKRRLSVFTIILSVISVSAITVSVFLAVSNHRYLKKEKVQAVRLEDTKKTNHKISKQVTSLKMELKNKISYIEEWDGVYQQLSVSGSATTVSNLPTEQTLMGQDLSYASLYPELCVGSEDKSVNNQGKKIVHLTFDDGPDEKTGQVLDLLEQYGIKATFFVTYTDNEELKKYYKEIVEHGHTIAVHTSCHDYKKIYSSVEAYLEDFNKIYQQIYSETGVKPVLFRFPGGSSILNKYPAGVDIIKEMTRRGFIYYDWNVSSGDGGNQATEGSILQWVTEGVGKYKESVVLMHDTRTPTVIILPELLNQLTQMGCVFEPLDTTTKKVQFYNKKY